MKINLFDELLISFECQLLKEVAEIQQEKKSTLFGIECTMEGAVDKIELASLDKQYEKAEQQFDQEIIFVKRKTVKDFLGELDRLTKHIKKVYSTELENQIKQKESEIQKEKESVLFGIECMMEGAVDKAELASLNRLYDVAEKQFDQEMLNQKNRIIKEYLITMEKLMRQIKKVY